MIKLSGNSKSQCHPQRAPRSTGAKCGQSLVMFLTSLVLLCALFASKVASSASDSANPVVAAAENVVHHQADASGEQFYDYNHQSAAFSAESSGAPARARQNGRVSAKRGVTPVQQAGNSSEMVMVHEREFVSPLVRVQIECQRDKTIMRVNFTKPFSGSLGAGKLDTTKCKLQGNGTNYYELQVKHNSTQCDTQWDSANSSIFNTLFIRFHPSLETGSDLAKNIMCRLTVGDLIVGRRPSVKFAPNEKQPAIPKAESQASPTGEEITETRNSLASERIRSPVGDNSFTSENKN